ncbi:MAG: nucleoside monophosphate kinase [Minisyncoccia bacterium]|jgi:adenylate kinase family enzyme
MKDYQFPLFKTKIDSVGQKFSLDDPIERKKYFTLKVGPEIEKIKEYLRENTFVGILLGKKNSGKGTYAKLFAEAIGPEHIRHISVGDIVRAAHEDLGDSGKKEELREYLKNKYRGSTSLDEAIDSLLGRSTSSLLPTELILALVEKEISKSEHKAIFIDGFPRSLDQISYSLYFRELMGYRNDPDFFVFIDLPEPIIDERMKYRVICPVCKTPRNPKLLRTKEIEYEPKENKFYLICDNPACGHQRMVPKEGDELGIEAVRDRIEVDEAVMKALLNMQGVPKVYLRNAIPVSVAKEYVDDYEITPGYRYEWDAKAGKVNVFEEPWTIKDDDGNPSYSLMPTPIVVSFISQVAKILNL